jgi:hypothetical protein
MGKPDRLTALEWDQLRACGRHGEYSGNPPYWWGPKTMPKLAARGLVEPHPNYPKAWRITEAGKQLLIGDDHAK